MAADDTFPFMPWWSTLAFAFYIGHALLLVSFAFSGATMAGDVNVRGNLLVDVNVSLTTRDLATVGASGARTIDLRSGAMVSVRDFTNTLGTLTAAADSNLSASGNVTTGGQGPTRRFGNLTLNGAGAGLTGALEVLGTFTLGAASDVSQPAAVQTRNLVIAATGTLRQSVASTVDVSGSFTQAANGVVVGFGSAPFRVAGDVTVDGAAAVGLDAAGNPLTLNGNGNQNVDAASASRLSRRRSRLDVGGPNAGSGI